VELVITLSERERERKKETKKRDRGRKVIWAQGLVAARAAEATAGGRDGGSLTDSCASLRCNSELCWAIKKIWQLTTRRVGPQELTY